VKVLEGGRGEIIPPTANSWMRHTGWWCESGTVLVHVRDTFQHRRDKLYEREFDVVTGWITERFAPGNQFRLKGVCVSCTIHRPPSDILSSSSSHDVCTIILGQT